MTMQIGDKLKTLREEAAADPDLARRLGIAGKNAIIAGMLDSKGNTTTQWTKLMEFITDEPKELERLCGQDPVFLGSDWGPYCLAYIAGDATCTVETPGSTGTRRTMEHLDAVAGRNLLGILDMEQE